MPLVVNRGDDLLGSGSPPEEAQHPDPIQDNSSNLASAGRSTLMESEKNKLQYKFNTTST